ncbi:MAG: ABC transporter substrate-binding protein [Chloroflexi bacterium]|nr:ABC transporter substrate-binding protein [Chloroflexota bacterium]MBT3863718.1 ABC transporter substrate-binding protein [Chloroflexota bacterium]MBT4142446.1 ABC transporter substrate-binding protein [Chloroflexota bacterium]MBT7078960.1 ABC transporter substrate-binding protein [Chloroflexota bacterium]MBT7833425.1 ABC transporter substrate-binding protein [Chloroflexota bacterium]
MKIRSVFERILATSALLITVLLITQCTTSDPEPTTTSMASAVKVSPTFIPTAAPTPTSTPSPTATPLATPTAIPPTSTVTPPDDLQRGGTLRFAIPEGAPHSDPHLTASSSLASWGAGLAYSRLFKFDTVDGNSTVVCDLCDMWEQTEPLTFKILLRDDITWQKLPPLNGRPLTAQDVIYSLNRQATADYANSPLLSNITEFTAVGEREILIRLNSPDAEVLEKLADSHSRIVAKDAVGLNGDLRRGPTIGSGPWIANEVHADNTILIANTDYYNDQLPYLDGIHIQVIPSESVRVAGMRSKVIDLAQASPDSIADARERFEDIHYWGVENPATGVEIALNTNRSPMDKQGVREAMMLTLQPNPIHGDPGNDTVSRVFGGTYVQSSLGLPLLNNDRRRIISDFENRFNDQDAANALLATVSLKPTDNVIIKVGEFGQEYIDQANELATRIESVGIRVEVERVSTRLFGDEVWIAGDYDIMIGAPPPISSTTAYLFAVHHSDGPWNTTGYSNSEIDRLIETQAREYDSAKRDDMLLEIQQLILAGSHRFIVKTRTTHWMLWDYVSGFTPHTPRGDTDFLTRVWLSTDE